LAQILDRTLPAVDPHAKAIVGFLTKLRELIDERQP
jgi:hypothetical protein